MQPDPSDTEMQEAQTEQSTPREEVASENEEGNVEDGGDADEADDVDEAGSGLGTPSRSRTRQSATPVVPQKRRAGRPPKNPRPQDWDASDVDTKPASDTPKRGRGGFRGGRGGRWKNRGGSLHVSQVAVDKDGTMANVKDDEVELPEDPDGETKVDKDGHLQEGREYRVRTFTVAGKGRRLYMLSTEPARCIGFRDSYLFFQKHKHLFKIILSEEAKRDLIEREVLPHSYKGRAIGVVTARSVFREFGAKITVGGKKITDDYKVAECRANGDIEGEVAVPEDVLPGPGEEYDRNRFVAWHGASSVYHSGMPTVPLQNGKQEIKKKRIPITDSNWMLEHARAARYVLVTFHSVRFLLFLTFSFVAALTPNYVRCAETPRMGSMTSIPTRCIIQPTCNRLTRSGWKCPHHLNPQTSNAKTMNGDPISKISLSTTSLRRSLSMALPKAHPVKTRAQAPDLRQFPIGSTATMRPSTTRWSCRRAPTSVLSASTAARTTSGPGVSARLRMTSLSVCLPNASNLS